MTRAKEANKPIFVDIYTEWCGPCKWMDQNVFNQQETGDFMNREFINVKLDAERFQAIFAHISANQRTKHYPYFLALERFYELHYQNRWAMHGFTPSAIDADLEHFDQQTKDYLRYCVLKFNFYDANQGSTNVAEITAPIQTEFIEDMSRKIAANNAQRPEGLGYLDADLGRIPVTNYQGDEINFAMILQNTEKPFIYFDFCGSWCVPCLDEMDAYAKSDRIYDNHEELEVVYVFFEADDTKWKDVIQTYGLDPEHCYLVTTKELQAYFSKHHNWMATFPHHFVMRGDGKMVTQKAPALTQLQREDYIQSAVEKPPVTSSKDIPPPPGRKIGGTH